MKCDLVIAGVGGQGVLSLAALIAAAALREGLTVKQSEEHGMAQRGGAVSAHLRMSSAPIWSDIIPRGTADLIVSVEPLEALRYLDYLSETGALVAASEPFRNIAAYPDEARLLERLRAFPGAVVVDAERLAKKAGLPQAANVVLIGAAADRLPVAPEAIEAYLAEAFAARGQVVVEANLRAFRMGREARSSGGLS